MFSPYTLSSTTRYLALGHQLPWYVPTSKTKPSTSMHLIKWATQHHLFNYVMEFLIPQNAVPFPLLPNFWKLRWCQNLVWSWLKHTLGSKHRSEDLCYIHQEDTAIVSSPNPYHPDTQVSPLAQVRFCVCTSISGNKSFQTGSRLLAAPPRSPYILYKDS